jgi:hypothetical protein
MIASVFLAFENRKEEQVAPQRFWHGFASFALVVC